MQAWHPSLDVRGNASKYQHVLQEILEWNYNSNMENIDHVMYEAAICLGVRIEVPNLSKPWNFEELQNLMQRRCFCGSAPEISNIKRK